MMGKFLKTFALALCLLALVASAQAADVLSKFNKIAVGATSFSTGVINLAPGTTAARGIYFGNDVTLYRSAANTLKTDDSLVVTGTLTTGSISYTTLSTTGNTTLGDGAGDAVTVNGTPTFAQDATFTNQIIANGNVTLGNASTDTITCNGRLIVRIVTDAGPMTATNGTQGEIVFETSTAELYICTVTGTPATWKACT